MEVLDRNIRLRCTLATLNADAERYRRSWNVNRGFGFFVKLILLCPGFQLSVSIRLQSLLGRIPLIGILLRRILWYCTTIYFGSDIDPKATFGPGIYFPHPLGIVIGGDCHFGPNVTILQRVTVGRRGLPPHGMVLVEESVEIGSGVCIIGDIKIGQCALIGANAVVVDDIPEGSVAVGIPAKIIRTNEVKSRGGSEARV